MSFYQSEGQSAEYAERLRIEPNTDEVLMHMTSGISLKFALLDQWREN